MGTNDELIKYAVNKIYEQAGYLDYPSVQKTIKQAEDALAYTRIKMKGWTQGAGDADLKAIAQAEGKREGAPPPPPVSAGREGGAELMGGSGTFLDAEVPAAAAGSQQPPEPKAAAA